MPWLPGATLFVDIGVPVATGLHQVDNPAIDAEGRVYVTYSGARGQQAPVSIFRIAPGGPREAVRDGHRQRDLDGVRPRSAGSTCRAASTGPSIACSNDGQYEVVASDLGLACGLAFAPDGTMLVGDRSGTIFHIDGKGRTASWRRSRPASQPFIWRWARTMIST